MEDKDLDQYFKDRSGAFNEAPGEGLWAKIEAHIEPVPPAAKGSKWLWPGVGAVVVSGLVAAWLVTRLAKEQTIVPAAPKQEVIVTPTVKQEADTVTPYIVPESTTTNNAPVTHSATKATPLQKTVVKADAPVQKQEEPPVAAAPQKEEEKPAGIQPQNTLMPSYREPDNRNIPYSYELDKGKDVIEISVTDKITRAERNALIKSTIELNAPYPGRKIIIKAMGYRMYRHTITKEDSLSGANKGGFKGLGHATVTTEVLIDTVHYKLQQDTLQHDTVRFRLEPKADDKQ